jgi:hypothetical protein
MKRSTITKQRFTWQAYGCPTAEVHKKQTFIILLGLLHYKCLHQKEDWGWYGDDVSEEKRKN